MPGRTSITQANPYFWILNPTHRFRDSLFSWRKCTGSR